MTQSSHFTKTTPRFPFADLCIPAGRSLFIHHSHTGAGWGGDHRCLKDTNYETILPPKGNRKRRKQLPPTAKAFKFSGFRRGLWELPKSPFTSSRQAKQCKKLQRLNFTRPVSQRGKHSRRWKANVLSKSSFAAIKLGEWTIPPNEVLEAARGCTPRFNGKKQEGSRPSPSFAWGLTPDAIHLQLPVPCTTLALTCTAQGNIGATHGPYVCKSNWRIAPFALLVGFL